MIDTNVLVAGLRSGGGASRQVLRLALEGTFLPLFSNALWLEEEDVMARPIWTEDTSPADCPQVLAALAAAGRRVKIYYGWRPDVRDPGDDYLIELAVAGGARAVITHNISDLHRAELRWPGFVVLTPSECLEKFS